MDEIPPELKYITTYLQRAEEVQAKDPIIAYYCTHLLIKADFTQSRKLTDGQAGYRTRYLIQDKAAIGDMEAIQNDTIGYAHVENFALKMFLHADNEDRAGEATKKTAKTFLAASTFLEVLRCFGDGDLDVDTTQKIKYAKYKVSDIMKAIKQGRQPTPGPPGGEPDIPVDKIIDTHTAAELPSVPRHESISNKPIPLYHPSAPTEPPNLSNIVIDENEDLEDEDGYSEEERKAILAAGKHAKFAMSALLYDDVRTAIENLEKGLALLRPLKQYD